MSDVWRLVIEGVGTVDVHGPGDGLGATCVINGRSFGSSMGDDERESVGELVRELMRAGYRVREIVESECCTALEVARGDALLEAMHAIYDAKLAASAATAANVDGTDKERLMYYSGQAVGVHKCGEAVIARLRKRDG